MKKEQSFSFFSCKYNWNLIIILILLFNFSFSSLLFSQEVSKEEERQRYETSKLEKERSQKQFELKKSYTIWLNKNASQKDFDIAIKDLNDSKKFSSVKSTYENKRVELTCKEAMLPEDIKEIVKKSGLGISNYTCHDKED